jgi:hypothetical protein
MIIHVRVTCVKGLALDDRENKDIPFAKPDNAQIMEEEV